VERAGRATSNSAPRAAAISYPPTTPPWEPENERMLDAVALQWDSESAPGIVTISEAPGSLRK
jgi:hypothetical protein